MFQFPQNDFSQDEFFLVSQLWRDWSLVWNFLQRLTSLLGTFYRGGTGDRLSPLSTTLRTLQQLSFSPCSSCLTFLHVHPSSSNTLWNGWMQSMVRVWWEWFSVSRICFILTSGWHKRNLSKFFSAYWSLAREHGNVVHRYWIKSTSSTLYRNV